MEAWRRIWREGLAPQLSHAGLTVLRHGLLIDDCRLLQGVSTMPPPLASLESWSVEGACPLGYCGWQGDALSRVGEVERYFGRLCAGADERLGERGMVRHFLDWFDMRPRALVRQ